MAAFGRPPLTYILYTHRGFELNAGTLERWNIVTLGRRNAGTLKHWNAGTQEHRNAGMLEHSKPGTLGCWKSNFL